MCVLIWNVRLPSLVARFWMFESSEIQAISTATGPDRSGGHDGNDESDFYPLTSGLFVTICGFLLAICCIIVT